ncbi:hypothetical protein FA95DRAFT_1554896 [Auriscalpium vulgare]|uniref:Uncharacterized protein n=1 Tax=Auriscalpium vulgare TaxID=40419 RepID=A0ACB8S5K4_9AGAM|nr:hypothetical protein FA95DRAFT_1554896 [Auriscalpium vulgare]
MDRNGWYNSPAGSYQQQGYSQPPSSSSRAAADSVQDAQRLLAVYPLAASANPTSHVTRHMSTLTVGGTAPSYVQPHYYSVGGFNYPAGNPPPYTEYATEVNHIQSQQPPAINSGYWETTRNDAVRYLGDQRTSPYVDYQPRAQYSAHSYPTYSTTPFAQSVFQHTMPSFSYPTPPPPGIQSSSSSLAYALDDSTSRAPRRSYSAQESASFFNQFLDKSSRELERAQAAKYSSPATPKRDRVASLQTSPDPIALGPTQAVTPQKRKSEDLLQSPSFKRIQSLHRTSSSSSLSVPPSTPSSSSQASTSSRVTPSTQHKRKMQAYVELPPVPKTWSVSSMTSASQNKSLKTPVSSRKGKERMDHDDDDEDLGGFGTEEDDHIPRKTSLGTGDTVKALGKRTGGRDDRGPLEKLTSLLEDIFEAEDAIPADADPGSLPTEFFSPLTMDTSHPQLHPNMIRKLTKYITQVTRPTKRLRAQSLAAHTPRPKAPGSIADLDIGTLSRTLKILERTVRLGEDLDPFATDKPPSARAPPSSPTKKKVGKSGKKATAQSDQRSTSQMPNADDDAPDSEPTNGRESEAPAALTDDDFLKLSRILEIARDSILAADCCIALLGSDRLPKQVYSEELITTCLSAIKNQLNKMIYPFIEAPFDAAQASPILRHITRVSSSLAKSHRVLLADVYQALSSVLPRVNNLVCADTVLMSDSIIIQAVYIAIGPFFVAENESGEGKGKKESIVQSTLGQSAMRGLRLDALSLIRSIFANHEDQRSWIIEEILSSLIKLSDTKQKAGQFRLRDGRSIRTVSALLLQLVQTSAHGVRLQARKLGKVRHNAQALRRQESISDMAAEREAKPFLDDKDVEEINLYMSGLESAMKAAKTIVVFLTQRSGKGKATKNSNEAEYRAIFDNLVSDLLVVLFWPEWPAASLLLGIICKFMVSSLDDVKNATQADSNAAKTIALDHLGVIAARLRSSTLKFTSKDGGLKPLDEIMSTRKIRVLERLIAAHQDVATHLAKRSSEDQAYDSARELTAVTWGQELAIALRQCDSILSHGDGDDLDLIQNGDPKTLPFAQTVKSALRDVWKDAATDVFDIGSQEEVARVDQLAEEIGVVQDLKNSYQPMLNVILMALDAPPVFMRTKALRALGQIVTSDPSILSAANVRRGIESHLLDSSPAVREAAVELIGKYMVDSPEVAGDYYQRIADRIADTGLGVRKRVIKLLKSFYGITDDNKRRNDICTKVVFRMFDEDDTVKDLAVKTIEELWFQPTTNAAPSQRNRSTTGADAQTDKAQLLTKVSVIMGVTSNFKDRQSPLEDVLHKIMAHKEGTEAADLHQRYGEICEALIDGLVDASELPGFTVVNCIRTIHLFTSAYPPVLSGTNASTLLPYLKNATSSEEQITSDYLLKIFRVSIPHMPKTAAKFGQELQLALQPMILKPSTSGGVQALQETVACLCAVVQNLTHDFARLVGLLKSCNARLQAMIKKTGLAPADVKALSILIFIISLLVEHCNFDKLREREELTADINAVSKDSIIEHVYRSLLCLYQKQAEGSLKGRTLQCLGFLFRAQPSLMTLESSAMIMDATFASQEEDSRARLLKIMQDFLVSEAAKHALKEKNKAGPKGRQVAADVNMDELVGNTDGFADSGVSSAIVQRYMDPILSAALSQHVQTQATAVDILSFTVKQGLAHPLQSFPVIVALETSANASLSARASALHAILHSKHASLLNSRYTVSARASFDYQKTLANGPVQGARTHGVPTALLHRWYSLVREKRAPKLDFLKALVRVFDLHTSLSASADDVDFARYMAENFAAFEYKTQEEVLLVLKSLTNVLSTAGMQVVEALSPAHLLAQLRGDAVQPRNDGDVVMADAQELPAADAEAPPPPQAAPIAPWQILDKMPLLRSSVIIVFIMLLKAYLKTTYGLSEDKCLKWVIGKKNALGDKPAVRRNAVPLTWERVPFATRPLLTTADMAAHRDTFLEIWNEDGVTAEPEEDM